MSEADRISRFMAQAVALSRRGMDCGAGGPFGAVIVRGDDIVAEGCNRVTSTNDPTAHAEIVAIREACSKLGAFSLNGLQIFASCEPCPMCLAAIYWARLDRLYYANTRHQAADIGFDDALIYTELNVPTERRRIVTLHLPHAGAQSVFDAWRAKPDKLAY